MSADDSRPSPTLDRISVHLETLTDAPKRGRGTPKYIFSLTAAIAVSISHVRACLCKAWHLQDMKINRTRQNCAQRLRSTRALAIPRYGTKNSQRSINPCGTTYRDVLSSRRGSRPFIGIALTGSSKGEFCGVP